MYRRAVEDGVKVAAFQQKLVQTHRGVVGVRQEGIHDGDDIGQRLLFLAVKGASWSV